MAADVAKEMQIRRRIESIYNKSRADFPGLKEWGDYEEEREDIIYNLSQGLDVEATQKKVEEYEKANSDEILRNQAQKSKEKWKQNAKSGMSLAQGGKESEEQSGNDGQAGAPIADNSYRPADLAAHLQAAPVQVVKQQQQGAPHERPQLSMEEIGAISGWTPDLQRRRAREEAYSSLLCF